MTITHLITADELEAMGSDARFELIQGMLHEMSPSNIDSSIVGMRLGMLLAAYVYEHKLGVLTGENAGFTIQRNPDTVVAPDLGFIRRSRYEPFSGRGGFFPGASDLAVEVISPSEEPAEIRRKQALYDGVEIPLVWWIDPKRRTATVHVPGQATQHLGENDALDGANILPGFSVQLGSLFDF